MYSKPIYQIEDVLGSMDLLGYAGLVVLKDTAQARSG